jgi:hypothetical protein
VTTLSIRAYARHRGLKSDNAVRKAIAAGRITLEPDGKIDPEKADAEWAATTDPARQPGNRVPSSADRPPAEAAPAGAPPAGGAAFAQARTVHEATKAEVAGLRLAKLKGELVDRQKAQQTVFDLARRERDAWINWPPRVAAQMAAELQRATSARVDAHALETILVQYVREHLADLAEVEVALR